VRLPFEVSLNDTIFDIITPDNNSDGMGIAGASSNITIHQLQPANHHKTWNKSGFIMFDFIAARAQALGTINYEVATSLAARLPRIFVDDFQ
jgi:hypothetical protein